MTFDDLLAELSRTRSRYEELRVGGGPLADRAETLARLHSLRSAIAELRSSV